MTPGQGTEAKEREGTDESQYYGVDISQDSSGASRFT